DEDRIDGSPGGDEQPVAAGAAECQVRDRLRHEDLAEKIAFGRKAMDAVSRTRPQIALDIQPESNGPPVVDRAEDAAIGEPAAIDDVEDADMARGAGIVTGG